MNVERFHAIVRALQSELEETQQATLLEELANATRQLSADPTQQPTQQQVSQVRGNLDKALRRAPSNAFSPAWREALHELGVTDLFGDVLADQLESIFSRNAITPVAAADEIDQIKQRVDDLVEGLNTRGSAGVGSD